MMRRTLLLGAQIRLSADVHVLTLGHRQGEPRKLAHDARREDARQPLGGAIKIVPQRQSRRRLVQHRRMANAWDVGNDGAGRHALHFAHGSQIQNV